MSILSRFFGGAPATVELKTENARTSQDLSGFFSSRFGTTDTEPTYSSGDAFRVFAKNPVAYQCVTLIAQQLGAVDLIVKNGDTEIEDKQHPYVKLLKRPSRTVSGARFFAEIAANLQLYGNAYIVRSKSPYGDPSNLIKRGKGEMRLLDPQSMNIVQDGGMFAVAYQYTSSAESLYFPVDKLTGACDLLHLKLYHPTNRYEGLPAVSAAYIPVLNHNAGMQWNYSQLANNAVPAAAIVLRENAALAEGQAAQIRNDFDKLYRGAGNSGKTAVLAEMDIELLGTDPQKMQYTEGQEAAARNIALALGVSPMLLGLPGDNTYANMEAATAGLYQGKVMPMLDYILEEMSVWLSDVFGDMHIAYDSDSIPALEVSRQAKWQALKDVPFLSINEKRAAMGYAEVKNGDKIPGTEETPEALENPGDLADPAPKPLEGEEADEAVDEAKKNGAKVGTEDNK